MDDWVVMAPSRWKLRKAIRTVNMIMNRLRVEQHPDKTFIGRVSKGFDFLGYHFEPGNLGVAEKTIRKFVSRAGRLYERATSLAERRKPSGAAIIAERRKPSGSLRCANTPKGSRPTATRFACCDWLCGRGLAVRREPPGSGEVVREPCGAMGRETPDGLRRSARKNVPVGLRPSANAVVAEYVVRWKRWVTAGLDGVVTCPIAWQLASDGDDANRYLAMPRARQARWTLAQGSLR